MIRLAASLVIAARQGNRAALSAIVKNAERPVYNLAMRMLAHPEDAQDATQEILIKIITNLGSIRDVEAAGGWAMRIACRHLIASSKRGRVEAMRLTFDGFADDLARGLDVSTSTEPHDPETELAINEIKIGCTLALLTCLKREARLAYVLGEIFELSDSEAAEALEIAPATYRQRLKRSRDAILAFMNVRCGNVSKTAACRCERRLTAAEKAGRISRGNSTYGLKTDAANSVLRLRSVVHNLEEGRRAAALMRSNPQFTSEIAELVMEIVETNSN